MGLDDMLDTMEMHENKKKRSIIMDCKDIHTRHTMFFRWFFFFIFLKIAIFNAHVFEYVLYNLCLLLDDEIWSEKSSIFLLLSLVLFFFNSLIFMENKKITLLLYGR